MFLDLTVGVCGDLSFEVLFILVVLNWWKQYPQWLVHEMLWRGYEDTSEHFLL